jgi:hypothetical protein
VSPKLEQLADALAPLIAERVADQVAGHLAELIEANDVSSARPLTAAEVADRLGRSLDFVYAHRDELGGVKLGAGEKARLAFPPEAVDRFLGGQIEREHAPKRSTPRARRTPNVELLPIRGGGGNRRAAVDDLAPRPHPLTDPHRRD